VAREAARRAGADGFVSKSEFAERLMPVIRGLFEKDGDPSGEGAEPGTVRTVAMAFGPGNGQSAAAPGRTDPDTSKRSSRQE
jgi:hypothetical protein